jgi:hypothetical protein
MSIEHRVFFHSAAELRTWIRPSILVNQNYALRSNGTELVVSHRSRTKYGDITFKNLISELINEFKIELFQQQFKDFNFISLNNFDLYVEMFFKKFKKFKVIVNLDYLFNLSNLNKK